MSFPKDYLFTKDHEWLKVDGVNGVIGISSFAVEQLGDVVHVELPKVGQKFKKGDSFGTVESTKTVSDLYMPAGGVVTEINTALKNSPEKLAEDPHSQFWLVKVTVEGEVSGLMNTVQYEKYIADEASHH